MNGLKTECRKKFWNINKMMIPPCGAGGGIRPPFPWVSHEATKRVFRWQRVYGVRLRRSPYCLGWRNQNAGWIRCHYSQACRAQSPLNPFYTWYNRMPDQSPTNKSPRAYFIFLILILTLYWKLKFWNLLVPSERSIRIYPISNCS